MTTFASIYGNFFDMLTSACGNSLYSIFTTCFYFILSKASSILRTLTNYLTSVLAKGSALLVSACGCEQASVCAHTGALMRVCTCVFMRALKHSMASGLLETKVLPRKWDEFLWSRFFSLMWRALYCQLGSEQTTALTHFRLPATDGHQF